MIEDLQKLYNQFEKLNNQDISTSPSMSNHSMYDFGEILYDIEAMIEEHKLTRLSLTEIKDALQGVNHCYYQPSELREPVRINNCKEIEICNKLMEEL